MYWLVSLPLTDSADRVWSRLQEATTYSYEYSINFKFKIPDSFKVGTLDTLLTLSDDLIKVNSAVEGTVNKIRRQLYEIQSSLSEEERSELWVEGMTPESYMQRFAWNEAKYPSRRPHKDTIHAIMETVQKLDDDLKVKATEYSQIRTTLQAAIRKQQGSLAVRDLTSLFSKLDVVSTENLTTLVAVVPKTAQGDWLENYETLTDFVVPRSSELVEEDNDYCAYTVVLFRRVADSFKAAARTKGFQVRDVASAAVHDENKQNGATEEASTSTPTPEAVLDTLRSNVEVKRAALERWCLASYGEVFTCWIHVIAIRLFVESVLRYGLPPQFLPVLMQPNPKHATKLRKVLAEFGNGADRFASTEGGGGGGGAGGNDSEFFPYVCFALNFEEH